MVLNGQSWSGPWHAMTTSELQQFIASTSAQMAFFHVENEDSPNF
jgi:hypothetical protein